MKLTGVEFIVLQERGKLQPSVASSGHFFPPVLDLRLLFMLDVILHLLKKPHLRRF
jgi:hypothetical protein